ncbi:unnamed protein product [Mytilus edulis]|uniref:MULE transposase domain-containing protein n=1 Tax=Mytilus edulis TaxID=6550 RepID=A0A8S3RU49_MYTED|nr:unnamed protein product [Mytilus edulis]
MWRPMQPICNKFDRPLEILQELHVIIIKSAILLTTRKKQHKSAPLGNITDEIVHIFSLVNNSDFVKEVVYTEGNNKPPSIICYTKDMMKDMTQFLKSDNDRILGVDRTFNLGAVFVTNFVYKNTNVIRKETGEHPIFIGPLFLHWEGSYLNYHTFFSHVKARIQESVKIIDLRIGSDDESGLTKALDDVFSYPGTTRMLCTKHMKNNISDHLKNKVGCNDKDRLQIIDNIFGSNGLVTTDDSVEFDLKSNEIAEKYPQFATYFKANLKYRLFDHVSVPMKQLKNQDRLWTNNNCESINHVFKKSINWKPLSLQDLVTNLHDITKVHFADLKRAIYGTGNYELFGNYTSHKVSLQCWLSKTPEQKDRLFLKLVNDCKTANSARVVRAVNTNFEIPLPQRLAIKPNQNKRSRLCRTKPRY